MVVQHNLTAMNANRMLGVTHNTLSKSTEKLSSGYRINRAADDAAGLSISEKMRKQIRGLDQASANAEDGISAVQTAEGALTEVHDMLQRMNELAVQAANGTNSGDDRQTIQDEISQLTTEIDRVAETTKFNETYLLKGNGNTTTKTLNAHDAGLAGKLIDNGNGTSTFIADKLEVGSKVTIGGKIYEISEDVRTDAYMSIKDSAIGAASAGADGSFGTITQDGVTYTLKQQLDKGKVALDTDDIKDANGNDATLQLKEGAVYTTTLGQSFTLVGNDAFEMDTALGDSVIADELNATDATGSDGTTKVRAGSKVIDTNGQEYTYVEKNGYLNDIQFTVAGFYKSDCTNATEPRYTVKAGDKYDLKLANGNEEKGIVANKGITTVSDIQKAIRSMATATGKSVTIYQNGQDTTGTTYTVGVSTKENGGTYTADDIANLVKAGNIVESDGSTFTADKMYYAVADSKDSTSQISAKEAYAMMQKELEEASSIGADSNTKAKVGVSTTAGKENVFTIKQAKVQIADSLSFALHVGADADMTNKIIVDVSTMSAAGLGIKDINVADDTGIAATYAVDSIEDAIKTVSKQRSALGAVQNRLEHTINNLGNVVENTTSAESQIRDTDMATEMVVFSNANVLAQAGQSMLAQANQSNQGILSLLG